MAAPARIDELRHRFAAQPRRYFAPLANALRQAGAFEEAVTMLRAQLAEYPDHLTGHVVLGQALFDTGALAESRVAFEIARALDPGTRVVLRHLGEIASLAGDQAAARLWFGRLRAADPYADDVAAQLGGSSGTPPEIDDSEDGRAAASIAPEQEVAEPTPNTRDPAGAVPEPFELLEFDAVPDEAAETDPVVGLDRAPAVGASNDGESNDGESNDGQPNVVTPLGDAGAAVLERASAGAAVEGELTGESVSLERVTSGPFATETMAGLLAAQGHTGQAIALYERLTADRPGDVALRTRLDALRGATDGDAPVARDADRGALLARAFSDLPRAATGTETGAVAAPPTSATSGTPDDPFEDLSFDRFFPGAAAAPTAAPERPALEPTAPEPTTPALRGVLDDSDLAGFDAWLRDAAT